MPKDHVMHHNIPTMIIDPEMLFREGLRRILYEADFQPVWCSDRPPVGPLPNLSDQVSPLLIIGTEIEEAIVQIAQVKRHYPSSRVVLLLEPASRQQLLVALHCGTDALVGRRSSCEALIGTLKLVLDGAAVFPSVWVDALLEGWDAPAAIHHTVAPEIHYVGSAPGLIPRQAVGLSARERSVLQQLRDGLFNKGIARELGIGETTVTVHVNAILRKAQLRNRTRSPCGRPGSGSERRH
jgi:two-component system nitrate/nitrite response regulator NarL